MMFVFTASFVHTKPSSILVPCDGVCERESILGTLQGYCFLLRKSKCTACFNHFFGQHLCM